jgi:hypothetical protein
MGFDMGRCRAFGYCNGSQAVQIGDRKHQSATFGSSLLTSPLRQFTPILREHPYKDTSPTPWGLFRGARPYRALSLEASHFLK